MKYCLMFLLFNSSIRLFAQDLPMKDGKVFYEAVDSAKGTKEQLYRKAKLWIANAFTDSKSVLEIDDKENGQLVGKGNVFAPVKALGIQTGNTCYFTFKIDIKDTKCRIQLYNVFIGASADNNYAIETWAIRKGNIYKKSVASANETLQGILTSFDKGINFQDQENF